MKKDTELLDVTVTDYVAPGYWQAYLDTLPAYLILGAIAIAIVVLCQITIFKSGKPNPSEEEIKKNSINIASTAGVSLFVVFILTLAFNFCNVIFQTSMESISNNKQISENSVSNINSMYDLGAAGEDSENFTHIIKDFKLSETQVSYSDFTEGVKYDLTFAYGEDNKTPKLMKTNLVTDEMIEELKR